MERQKVYNNDNNNHELFFLKVEPLTWMRETLQKTQGASSNPLKSEQIRFGICLMATDSDELLKKIM